MIRESVFTEFVHLVSWAPILGFVRIFIQTHFIAIASISQLFEHKIWLPSPLK